MTDRVIVLIDMDCFYCQVETRLDPSLQGKPLAVVQYNQWRGGGIIAVNYEARDRGVTRHMRGADAKEHCPEIILVTVPTIRDKADLTRYRDAGREVLSVFCRFSDCVQRASIDEAFVDISSIVDERLKSLSQFEADKWKSTFVVGYTTDGSNDEEERAKGMKSWLEDSESINNTPSLRLAVGALIVEEMREAVLAETGFKCSAGIAHNKILSKLACGLHKPNRQTVLPQESVDILYKTLPVRKIRNLGGKFGHEIVEKLGCNTMSDLAKFSEKDLQSKYDEKTGSWLYNIARGYDFEPVQARLVSKSIGCCKQFRGKLALRKSDDVYHWVTKLCEELSERLFEDETMNKRRATLLTVSTALEIDRIDRASSKSVALTAYSLEKLIYVAENSFKKMCPMDSTGVWSHPIKFLGLSAGKFTPINANQIDKFFKTSCNSNEKQVSINNKPDVSSTSDKKENASNEIVPDNPQSEGKMSFFEKVFARNGTDPTKKLLNEPNLPNDNLPANSNKTLGSSSNSKEEKNTISDPSSVTTVKKPLFDNTNCIESTLTPNRKEPKNAPKKNQDGNNKSILSFFNNQSKTDSWIKIEELFPDPNEVDEELLASLPASYKNKILEMKNQNSSREVDGNILPSISEPCEGTKSVVSSTKSDFPSVKFDLASTNSVASSDINCFHSEPRQSNSNLVDSNLLKCDECGEFVSDLETHMDMHVAKRLHKELNSYSSSTVTIKKPSTSNEKERKKRRSNTKPSNDNSKKIKSIETFFYKKL